MRTLQIIYKIVIILTLILMCISSTCYARVELTDTELGGGGGGNGDPSKGLPSTTDLGYKPIPNLGTDSKGMINIILGALTVVGIVVVVIGIGLIGLNILTGSASEKAVNQEKIVGIVIAALLIAGSSVIARIIINFAENTI